MDAFVTGVDNNQNGDMLILFRKQRYALKRYVTAITIKIQTSLRSPFNFTVPKEGEFCRLLQPSLLSHS